METFCEDANQSKRSSSKEADEGKAEPQRREIQSLYENSQLMEESANREDSEPRLMRDEDSLMTTPISVYEDFEIWYAFQLGLVQGSKQMAEHLMWLSQTSGRSMRVLQERLMFLEQQSKKYINFQIEFNARFPELTPQCYLVTFDSEDRACLTLPTKNRLNPSQIEFLREKEIEGILVQSHISRGSTSVNGQIKVEDVKQENVKFEDQEAKLEEGTVKIEFGPKTDRNRLKFESDLVKFECKVEPKLESEFLIFENQKDAKFETKLESEKPVSCGRQKPLQRCPECRSGRCYRTMCIMSSSKCKRVKTEDLSSVSKRNYMAGTASLQKVANSDIPRKTPCVREEKEEDLPERGSRATSSPLDETPCSCCQNSMIEDFEQRIFNSTFLRHQGLEPTEIASYHAKSLTLLLGVLYTDFKLTSQDLVPVLMHSEQLRPEELERDVFALLRLQKGCLK